MAKYPNLPGIEVSIADGGLILPEDMVTQSILIIDKSNRPDAPKEPVLVRQSSDLVTMGFGTFIEGGKVNPIAASWKAAHDGGCRRIYLMAIKGETDKEQFESLQDALFGILADFTVDHIVVMNLYADKEVTLSELPVVQEGVSNRHFAEGTALKFPLTVEGTVDDVIVVGDKTLTLEAKVYQNADEVIAEIHDEVSKTGVEVKAISADGKILLVSETTFSLGEGTTALGFKAGNATQEIKGNYALLLGAFAEMQTENHGAVVAYIGASAPQGNSLAQVKAHVDKLAKSHNEYSGYVQVIAGPELGYILPGRGTMYFMNGAVTYAALTSTLRPESATTNKRVYGVAGAHYNLSPRQLNQLTGNKFVTFRVKGNQIVVTDGCTTAPSRFLGGNKMDSDFARLSTLRITQAAVQLIRELTEPYIGEPNRMPQYNAMSATVKGGLEAMKEQGAIFDYRFSITSRGGTLSEAIITLELVPAFELKRIQLNVSLRPPEFM